MAVRRLHLTSIIQHEPPEQPSTRTVEKKLMELKWCNGLLHQRVEITDYVCGLAQGFRFEWREIEAEWVGDGYDAEAGD